MASYRKRDNGLWEYRISYKTPDGKYKRKEKGGFKTKKEAQLASLEFIENGTTVDKSIMLKDYFKIWYEVHKKTKISDGTKKGYQVAMFNIEKFFGDIEVQKLNPTKYQKALNEMAKTHRKGTIKGFNAKVKSCLKYAVADGIIKTNPAELAIVTSSIEPKPIEEKFLELDEYQHLINVTKSDPFKHRNLQLYLLAVTGMRVGESLGLTWTDIDLENGYLDINKTWSIYTNDFAPTKNPQSVRKIPISDETIEILEKFKKICDNDRVFTSEAHAYLNTRIKAIVGRPVHVHSLRHTYVSYLLHKGIEVLSISKIIGHRDITVTLNTYSHLLAEKQENDYREIKKLFIFGAD